MVLKRFVVGPLEVNCYLIIDEETKEAVVVDPGDNVDEILDYVKRENITIKYIINTHCHFDHAGGNKKLKEATNALFLIHEKEKPVLDRMDTSAKLWGFYVDPSPNPDMLLKDGDKISIGNLEIEIIHTPGHSPGGICLKFSKYVISGDTLFAGGIGRTDFPGGDYDTLIKSIKEKLFTLPEDTEIFPGHGPSTTVKNEKYFNPFF